jgi:pyruvate,water dikinase
MTSVEQTSFVRPLQMVRAGDIALVGGKNASLGEMISTLRSRGIAVPDGFAITTDAWRELITANDLASRIDPLVARAVGDGHELDGAAREIRQLILDAEFPEALAREIETAYRSLSAFYGVNDVDVAVRSSATAEDLPDASFAGQQESYLNVSGAEALVEACRRCYASLFTARAISYRHEQNIDTEGIALSICVQKMVRSDLAGSGVLFSIDPESGFPNIVVINAAWGLGENIVQGSVTPDEYMVFKPLLDRADLRPVISRKLGMKEKKLIYAAPGSAEPLENIDTTGEERRRFVLDDDEILMLARWACIIEQHYGCPMDIEWAKDGRSGELYIVQARPETVQSQSESGVLKSYTLLEHGTRVLSGIAVGEGIATGDVCLLRDAHDIANFRDGAILVTEMTDPDWVPIMRRAAAIVTDKGGRTCHAAIVSRELGVPAIVGAGNATSLLEEGRKLTVCCAEGEDGVVYDGILPFTATRENMDDLPETTTRLMLNIASPSAAFRWWKLPSHGIGLARMEFIITDIIKIHPMALVRFDELTDADAKEEIARLTAGYEKKGEYFVDHLAWGIAKIAASQYPEQVIVRMSDFKTNEYADLIGGREFEPEEANPMLGFRGASRYYSDHYREGFALECEAIRRARNTMGLTNITIMIPFCRTVWEADRVLEVLAENGLARGVDGLQIYMMAEIPSNVILADLFAERFDGFSIGSNDLTQLVLGIDRDAGDLSHLFDERNEAVKRMISSLIETAHARGRKVGICGQGPSDFPDFAAFLVEAGIDTISLNPDSLVAVKRRIAEMETKLKAIKIRGQHYHYIYDAVESFDGMLDVTDLADVTDRRQIRNAPTRLMKRTVGRPSGPVPRRSGKGEG